MIPRVLHQVWVGGPVPSRFDAYRESWARLHPTWELRFWHDGNIPELFNQRLFDQAAAYVPAANIGQFKTDLLRYELLWWFGGVYVDIDYEALKPIDPLLDGVECFAAWEVPAQWVNNAVMGSIPEHPFIRRLIDELPESAELRRGQTPNRISSPHHVTRLYRRHPDELTVFDQRLFYPYLYSDIGTAKAEPPWPDDAYAVHHWNNRRQQLARAR